MNVIAGISTFALLVLSLISVWRYPWTLPIFVVLFLFILIVCCSVAAKRADAYMWQFKRNE